MSRGERKKSAARQLYEKICSLETQVEQLRESTKQDSDVAIGMVTDLNFEVDKLNGEIEELRIRLGIHEARGGRFHTEDSFD